MKTYSIVGALVVSAFVGGIVIGNLLVPHWAGLKESAGPSQSQPPIQDAQIKTTSQPTNQITTANEPLQQELNNLKSDYARVKAEYAQKLDKEILARTELEQELARLKAGPPDNAAISGTAETKTKKPSPLNQAIRMSIEKLLKSRMNLLKEKGSLSAYQEAELERLTNEAITETAKFSIEMIEKVMAGEEMPPETMKRVEEIDAQYEQKLKELLTYQQYAIHQEILENERKENITRTVKMYMDGFPGQKGMTESLGLSQEQQQKVRALFEERLNSAKSRDGLSVSAGPQLPFDANDIEFTEKVKAVLTPEQYPKFDDYLKQQAEFRKMAEGFIPKKKETKESK